jgi:hypothetical protein
MWALTRLCTLVEGYEQAVQVNVLNTFLLELLLPKLKETKYLFPDFRLLFQTRCPSRGYMFRGLSSYQVSRG